MKDRQIKQALTPLKAVLIALFFIVLTMPAHAADSCTCSAELALLIDDSASMRRELDLILRTTDQLSARQWVTTGELTNFSLSMNTTLLEMDKAQKTREDANTARLDLEIKTVKIESIVLVLFAIVVMYLSNSWVYGEKYFELKRKYGVLIRRTPMTPREKDLEARVHELESQVKVESEDKPPTLKDRILSIIGLLMVVGAAIVLIYLAGLYWKVW